MRTQEIPRSEWSSFLESFATQHHGWLVNLDRQQMGNGSVPVLLHRPLDDIYLDKKTGHIVLTFKNEGKSSSETVEAPSRLRFLETKPGAHAGLEIQSLDGTSLVMRFRSAMPPEMIDGIAA
jgi:hypothetical protein